jgi:hypothetical protein
VNSDFIGTDIELLGKLHVPRSKGCKNKDIFWSDNILLSQIKYINLKCMSRATIYVIIIVKPDDFKVSGILRHVQW